MALTSSTRRELDVDVEPAHAWGMRHVTTVVLVADARQYPGAIGSVARLTPGVLQSMPVSHDVQSPKPFEKKPFWC